MQRSPYRASNPGPGRWWAARGYIFVGQLVRERGKSTGRIEEFGDYSHDIEDGYDAVEWAAKLPGANGKVGLIGHSDEGRLAWYAAVSAPPHLAAIAPSAATSDPWRIVPYAAMAFGPINISWACMMRDRNMATNGADLEIGEAITHLPLSALPARLGCAPNAIWDRWIAHPTLDAFWRARADQQGAGQAGPLGEGDRVDVRQCQAGVLQCLAGEGQHSPDVIARGQFRHHAAEAFVHRDLRMQALGEQAALGAIERDPGFVAGGFDSQNNHAADQSLCSPVGTVCGAATPAAND